MHTYTRHYRAFRQYFNKNRRTYRFEVKFLNVELNKDYIENHLKMLLQPLDVVEITDPNISYLHENPVEFPMVAFGRLSSIEIELGMSITAEELKMLLFEGLELPFENFIVYNYGDPSREAKRDYARLQDSIMDKYADENPYKLHRMGYDMEDESIQPQDLVGTKRLTDLLSKTTDTDFKHNGKLFQFIDEKED